MTTVVAGADKQQYVYRKLRAPTNDATALVDPSFGDIKRALGHANGWCCDQSVDGIEFCGKSLPIVRDQARAEILDLAVQYSNRTLAQAGVLNQPLIANPHLPIILSGHQPELFHPGVWFKNFLLDSFARNCSATAINFLVDNDDCRSPSIRVPELKESGDFTTHQIAFDDSSSAVPWEMRSIANADCWASFADRVSEILPAEVTHPTIQRLWPFALQAARQGEQLGHALAQARHAVEYQVGLRNLELPLSEMATTRSFARFCIQLLSELPRFQLAYNDNLHQYRIAHRIRNHAHPVPALAEEDHWLEAPLWVYRTEAPKRKRLWARIEGNQLLLSDREGWEATINGRLDCDNASTQWLKLAEQGVRLRPRALITTMFTRLLVGDLFVHGIGGAKYDQLTDTIMMDFYGIDPPPVCIATATLHLPLKADASDIEAAIQSEKQRLWQLQNNPASVLDISADETLAKLQQQKQKLLANIPKHGDKWQWHVDLTEVKRAMAEQAQSYIAASQARIEQLVTANRQLGIASSREYSFCLFPFDAVVSQLRRLANNVVTHGQSESHQPSES